MERRPRNDITVKTIAASQCSESGTKLYTFQCRYPRIIHSEFMTHRAFSRNASSSRAIPVATMLARDEIFIPDFKYNKAGMQPGEYLSDEDQKIAAEIWTEMAGFVMKHCQLLADKKGLNIAKQWVNRPLEWFGYIDVLVSSTDWANWDYLRDHGDAQDEIAILARKICETRDASTLNILRPGNWHLPYIRDEDDDFVDFHCDRHRPDLLPVELKDIEHLFQHEFFERHPISNENKLLIAMSAARSCRVSFAKHDGKVTTLREDVDRFTSLIRIDSPVHASPAEHQATPCPGAKRKLTGNFRHFVQFRKLVPNEFIPD